MLHDKLEKLMAKKGHMKMSDNEKKAKMGVLHDLKGMASDAMTSAMNDHIRPKTDLKKVSVMSDSSEGLHEGLEAAKHYVENDSMDHSAPSGEGDHELEDAGEHVDEEEGYHADPEGYHPEAMKEMGHDGEHDDGSEEPEESEDHLNAKLADYQKKLQALKSKKK